MDPDKHPALRRRPDFQDAEFSVTQVPKPGSRTLTGIIIRTKNSQTAPCCYIDSWYERMADGLPVGDIADSLAEDIKKTVPPPDTDILFSFAAAGPYIVPQLIDIRPGRNDGYIRNRPVTKIPKTDIGILYAVELPGEHSGGVMTAPVTNAILQRWNVRCGDVREAAAANGARLRPAELTPMSDVLAEMTGCEAGDSPLMILTNRERFQGAAVILYPGIKNLIDRSFPKGFWLLPSSVHEWIVMPKSPLDDVNALVSTVTEINRNVVSPGDVLADNVFTLDEDGNLAAAAQGKERPCASHHTAWN